jgi:predicted amidohydrolase YtcJ
VFPFLSLLLAAATAAAGSSPAPRLLFEGGMVYVSADGPAKAASIVVDDGRILFVGDAGKARALAPHARIVDVHGRWVFPGWTDAHLHLESLGHSREIADLRGAASAAEAAARIAREAASLPEGSWAEGRGWDQNRWPGQRFPDARDLDAVLSRRPAVARRVDGHAVWVNQAALDAAGISAGTKDPPGGRILRRPDGSASGVLVDNAMALVLHAVPAASAKDRERWLLKGASECARAGLTGIGDASAYDGEDIALLEDLSARRALPIRVYATVSSRPEELDRFFAAGPRIGRGADFLTVRAVKSWADGALGSRGALLLAPYSDDPGQSGLAVTSAARLTEIATESRRRGWQFWIHAIGDRANRIALDAFERAEEAVPKAPEGGTRPRIEHAQVVAPEDFPRFARYGVIASIQPTHATSDMAWAGQRLGPERIAGAYAWQRLRKAGARLAGGSDAPVESERPLLGFYAAVTRQDLSGNPPGGFRPAEKLSRREALALFTSDAAWACFEERVRGRIEPGFEADLTILAGDPMTVPEERIPAIPVFMTVVGGRIAWGPGVP